MGEIPIGTRKCTKQQQQNNTPQQQQQQQNKNKIKQQQKKPMCIYIYIYIYSIQTNVENQSETSKCNSSCAEISIFFSPSVNNILSPSVDTGETLYDIPSSSFFFSPLSLFYIYIVIQLYRPRVIVKRRHRQSMKTPHCPTRAFAEK